MNELDKWIKLCEKAKKYVSDRNILGEYPTFREVSKRYHINLDAVETLAEDTSMSIGVGAQVGGLGGGIYLHEYKGDYTLEVLS